MGENPKLSSFLNMKNVLTPLLNKRYRNCNNINVVLNGKGPFQCVIDTGADRSCIDMNFAKLIGFYIHKLRPGDNNFFTIADISMVRAAGIVKLVMSLGKLTLEQEFHVLQNLSAHLLRENEFMQKNEVKIDYKNCSLTIHE